MKKSFLTLTGIILVTVLSAQNWQTYLVYSGSAKNTGVVLDQQKCPHVFFYSPQTFGQHTNHSYWDGSVWVNEIIDGGAIIHNDGPSAALDSEGKIHVSYFNGDMKLAYAVYDGQWQTEVVDTEDETGDWCTLRLDSADNPHIAYSKSGSYVTKYAKKVNGTWEIFQLPGSGAYGVNMLIDDDGKIHIADTQAGLGIRYSTFDGQNWNHETGVAPATNHHSLTLDLAERPHVTYYLATGGNFDLFISIKEGKSWPTYLVDHGVQQSKRGWDNHLITDDNGIIHVFYLAHNEEQVRHAWGQNAEWETEVVDYVGDYNSGIEVTKDGNNLYTSYYDEDTQQIRLSALAGDFTPPHNLSAEVIDDDIYLQYEHVSRYSLVVPSFYRIYRNGENIAQVNGNIFTFTDVDPEPGVYEYYVTAVFNQTNESEPSNIVTVYFNLTVADPWFSPEPGNFTDSVLVEIHSETPGAVLHYTLDGTDPDENSPVYNEPVFIDTTTTVKARGFLTGWEPSAIISGEYIITYSIGINDKDMVARDLRCSPNPFSGLTKIEFVIGKTDFTIIEILNLEGKKIIDLYSGISSAGVNTVYWNGNDAAGVPQAAGTYICRLKTHTFSEEVSLILVR